MSKIKPRIQMTEIQKVRSLGRTTMWKVQMLERKIKMLRESQEELEKQRLDFQVCSSCKNYINWN